MSTRLVAFLLLAICATTLGLSFASAEQVTRADRESSYPAEVANVTQSPWRPEAGEDVTVTMRLADDARVPDSVSLLFCRIEPEYVCGIPFMMESRDDGSWTGVLQWDDRFMRPETVHVGYNLTLRYLDRATGAVERVAAPTGNHWVPATYPTDSDGVYFFYSYTRGDAGQAPGAVFVPLAMTLTVLFALARRDRGGGTRGQH